MSLLPKFFRRSKNPSHPAMSRRLEQSIEGAGYWVKRMPREAVHLVQRFRLYNVAAAAISLFTGLLAWPLIAQTSQFTAQVVLSTLSGLAALTIAVPHAVGLSDRTEETIKLCGTYGRIYGELLQAKQRLTAGAADHSTHAADLIRQYEDVTGRKDALALPGREGSPGRRELR
ncbi:hypothetical protein [Streptomyces jeddahensis]|uniref:Uncharacterized protein n=1 Tax=Streptomyces jeddahensis TaxID=1716141 RepID=A0A177HJI1_9ACTN|nr:hypothetical protein [Streptomyces jeddahensis]OAH11131.1 hypothetical protein STSP_55080 [Streptomyces jeddahensis]